MELINAPNCGSSRTPESEHGEHSEHSEHFPPLSPTRFSNFGKIPARENGKNVHYVHHVHFTPRFCHRLRGQKLSKMLKWISIEHHNRLVKVAIGKGCYPLLTWAEYAAGIERGKRERRNDRLAGSGKPVRDISSQPEAKKQNEAIHPARPGPRSCVKSQL